MGFYFLIITSFYYCIFCYCISHAIFIETMRSYNKSNSDKNTLYSIRIETIRWSAFFLVVVLTALVRWFFFSFFKQLIPIMNCFYYNLCFSCLLLNYCEWIFDVLLFAIFISFCSFFYWNRNNSLRFWIWQILNDFWLKNFVCFFFGKHFVIELMQLIFN